MTQSKLYINIVKYNFKRTKNDYQNSKILLMITQLEVFCFFLFLNTLRVIFFPLFFFSFGLFMLYFVVMLFFFFNSDIVRAEISVRLGIRWFSAW